ncbi:MAG: hypothetical protein ACD_25C00201G0002 [uncultured bacterium]|uniref:O-antigen ligase-related domain-containing protein n=3 Tax=Katanobacteria TaxID=422282 RepID=A0A1F4W376_UNCKA|nr:MAG: hypothetical protein ACD_25C00201G0002 [uncultured bacterium]KKS02117.1 MAG: O-antigen polymerase [candidate division WWE3 bacterium GW2011_GWC2_41_23]KKS10604.1 MAG: O-antigen polymerase [candidate division WWE3 bacterium GW2011_GWF2_41_45]KKS12385.1 MAG: O-antigen polymerase [candidate division WWE3 bacterium GW2011_GWF1_41_53]KKS20459.1 MAG: O-antigen polymerase [candidate division WWE3 bacterium GW2011_GWE1_41_72]KKS27271.1 MAG: O-antigen polymerase [candidate division WWE3 bacteri
MLLKYLLFILLGTLSLGQFARVGGYYLFDIAAAVFSFYGVVLFLINKNLKIPKYSVLFFIFSLLAGVSLILNLYRYSSAEGMTAVFYLVRFVIYLVSGLVVYNMVASKQTTRHQLEKYFTYSALFLCGAGLVQLILLPDFSVLDASLGWDPHKNRVASTFFDPNFLGAYLVATLTMLLGSVSEGKKDKFRIISLVVILLFIFLTFSRSAWAMLAVVIFIFGLFKQRKLLFLGLLLAFLAYFLVPRVQTRISGITDPADSARFRLVSWKNAIQISRDNLITGVGFNAYRYVQKEYGFLTVDNISSRSGAGADSSLLFVLATTGIFGALVFAAALAFTFLDNIFSKRKYRLVIVSLIPALMLESLFINSFFYPQMMFIVYAVIFSSSLDI